MKQAIALAHHENFQTGKWKNDFDGGIWVFVFQVFWLRPAMMSASTN